MSTERYLNPALSADERAEDLLEKLTLEEKVRQLGCTMVVPGAPFDAFDLKGGIGVSVYMGGTPENMASEIASAQKFIIENSSHHIPALFHAEGLSGSVSILGGCQYPISIGLGATFEPEVVEEMAERIREQYVAYGVRHVLSPVFDLTRDLRWGRNNETYGSDPTLVSEMAVSYVKGLQGKDLKETVVATGKHFLGYSQTEAGLNIHKTMVSKRELREQFAKPFEAAIHLAGLKTVMNSYSEIDGRPVSANKAILTDLLRDELGFDGPVISDYGSIENMIKYFKMTDDPVEAGAMCLEAGLDIECPARIGYSDAMVDAVREGIVSEEVIDSACRRVLKLKFELGLFENPYPRFEKIPAVMNPEKGNQSSHAAALKTIVLAKNNGILPITDKKKKLLVVGPTGNCLRMMFSHYTAVAGTEMMLDLASQGDTQQGFEMSSIMNEQENRGINDALISLAGGREGDPQQKYRLDDMIRQVYPETRTIFEALKERFECVEFVEGCDYIGKDMTGVQKALNAAKTADIVIACVGGKNGLGKMATSGEGVDSASLGLSGVQDIMMQQLYAVNTNLVIVHTDGRPLCSEWAYKNAAAILEAWLPNTYGGNAIAEVLAGEYNPAGRMPMDVPKSVGHQPVYHYQNHNSSTAKDRAIIDTGYIDSSAEVLAPFGFGLSYTKFSYDDFRVKMDEKGNVTACVTIKNIGDVDGDEVVQLYGSDLHATMIRPIQELIGFKRIHLKAGQKKNIAFRFNIDVLSFTDYNGNWIVEKGEFEFFVGANSDDRRGIERVTLAKTRKINANRRCFFANTEIV